ncbi:unnamed protein product [Phaedon cochleariae]|uniref:PPIase cyclophilin-type domain-containing protein n=1 Tax=Phaedon cochleariae TaxID=80249 RepID=A0A9P0DBH3_PHACE|nr:unnamed protein product [Phaedon cochleariae]
MSVISISEPSEKFFVAGIITCKEFQKCRYIVTKLNKCFPKLYEEPQIRPMLNMEWEEFLTNKRRKYGNGLWAVKKPVVIFSNGEYLGDDTTLIKHVSKKFRFALNMDWYEMGKCHLVEFLKNIMRKFRQLAYITVSINRRVVGTMMFELYNDLVPLACENFLTKCKLETGGYTGSPIQRIVKNSWIQCGGWIIPEKKMRCENYVIPHDRRGVLCMCNSGRHKGNSAQFFVTLAPAPWMDYRYVAFGQLIQGAEVLRQIEEVPTYYECPQLPIDIAMSGEVTFDNTPNFSSYEEFQELQHMQPTSLLDCLIGPRGGASPSTISVFSKADSKQGIESYMKGYLRFQDMDEYYCDDKGQQIEEVDDDYIESEIMETPSLDLFTLNDKDTYCQSPSDTTI